MIPLEDRFSDVLAKAQRGLGISDGQIVEQSKISAASWSALKEGRNNAAELQAVAPILELNAKTLNQLAEDKYRPEVAPVPGLAAFNTPYDDYTVNSYLIWDLTTREAIIFDTGADATELLHTIAVQGLKVGHVLLTHTHGDHVFDLDRVLEKTGAPAFTPAKELLEGATPFSEHSQFSCGSLKVNSLLTNGHSPGGTTFYVEGLAAPLAIVGDSIFAGSMGGAANAWQLARTNNREKILTLPKETILCPGHGPLTTVALELANNPFFAA